MPELVCRIRWRKGLPLGLSISPKTCFLDLPRELRDKIYRYSLVASEPITVWSGTHGEDEEDHSISNLPGIVEVRSWRTVDTSITTFDNWALSLLWCNQKVSREAAATLYWWNTFRFMGDNNWNSLYAFLQMLGAENRRSLRRLEIQVPKPKQVWQHPDGTRTSLHSWRFREVIPQSAHLQSYSKASVEGRVDHLDPAIEACFRILGKKSPALTLVLILSRHFLPGVVMKFDEQQDHMFHFGLDLPVMIEKLRQDFTADSVAKSQVEVLWKGECLRNRFVDQIELINNCGWVILNAEEGHFHRDTYTIPTMRFTVRRKMLSEASFPAETKAS